MLLYVFTSDSLSFAEDANKLDPYSAFSPDKVLYNLRLGSNMKIKKKYI